MGKHIKTTALSATLKLSECSDGYWLYDTTRGMNLSMRAKTPTDALVEALAYYQDRLMTVESEWRTLQRQVDDFVSQFKDDEED